MRGKVGLVIGIGVGYVLGTRAGRERYEQIKAAATKVWELDPVQNQVEKAKAFGASALKAVPGVVWNGAKKVTSAAAASGTAQERAQRAGTAAKSAANDVAEAVDDSVEEAKKAGNSTSRSSTTAKRTSSTAKRTSSGGSTSRSRS
jgi:hypothetical protein